MNKVEIVNIALGGIGVITGTTGAILGIVNTKAIKKLSPLESRMSVVESNVNALLNPATVVVTPASAAAPTPAAANQQAQQ
jgi:hypothetical protein